MSGWLAPAHSPQRHSPQPQPSAHSATAPQPSAFSLPPSFSLPPLIDRSIARARSRRSTCSRFELAGKHATNDDTACHLPHRATHEATAMPRGEVATVADAGMGHCVVCSAHTHTHTHTRRRLDGEVRSGGKGQFERREIIPSHANFRYFAAPAARGEVTRQGEAISDSSWQQTARRHSTKWHDCDGASQPTQSFETPKSSKVKKVLELRPQRLCWRRSFFVTSCLAANSPLRGRTLSLHNEPCDNAWRVCQVRTYFGLLE